MYKFLTFHILKPEIKNKKIPVFNKIKNSNPYDDFYSKIYDDLFYDKKRYQYEADIVNLYLNSNFDYLDLCTGSGSMIPFLNTDKVIGVDKSTEMLQNAIYKNKNKNIKFYKSDVNDIDKIETGKLFDGIGCFYFGLFYNIKWCEILHKLKDKIKKNGYLFISILDKNNLEIYYKKIKYENDILYYSGEYELNDQYPFIIKETIQTNNSNIIYKHVMYNPNFEYFEFICKKLGYKIINKIRYDKLLCLDEYLYILQKY